MTTEQMARLRAIQTLQGHREDDFSVIEEGEDATELLIGEAKGRPKLLVLARDGAILRHDPV